MTSTGAPNACGGQLTAEEIAAKEHRAFVGGMWEKIGARQFEFLSPLPNPYSRIFR